MSNPYEILRRPIVTEKTNFQTSKMNQVVFEVDSRATKAMVKDAIEHVFEVTVERVNIVNLPSKRSRRARNRRLRVRRSGYKKAIITLAPGSSIDIFEGVR